MRPAAPVSRRRSCRRNGNFVFGKLGSVSIDNRLSNSPLHLLSFAAQHGGLVCHANSLQMHVRIEPGRMGTFEFFQERLFMAAVADVVANVIGVGKR